jgi:predicted ArsR family transcriptional regulator
VEFSRSQENILNQLKIRGAQSVKILANRLGITTMGIRQHLEELHTNGFIDQTEQEKQTRGRPVHLWKLTSKGHGYFPNTHEEVAVDLIRLVQDSLGESSLDELINARGDTIYERYKRALATADEDLQSRLEVLTKLRTEEGYMAEIRLLPDRNWLLIENHCPISAAAQSCQQFCRSEQEMFQKLLAGQANISRVDYLLDGARRCAYKVEKTNHQNS